MLSCRVYELLPVSYMLTGVALITFSQNKLILFAGCVFFSAGSMVWIIRSSYRRQNQTIPSHPSWVVWPEIIYELKPFFYILTGLMAFQLSDNQQQLILSMLLCCWGMFRLNQRIKSRHHRMPSEPILIVVPHPTPRSEKK